MSFEGGSLGLGTLWKCANSWNGVFKPNWQIYLYYRTVNNPAGACLPFRELSNTSNIILPQSIVVWILRKAEVVSLAQTSLPYKLITVQGHSLSLKTQKKNSYIKMQTFG